MQFNTNAIYYPTTYHTLNNEEINIAIQKIYNTLYINGKEIPQIINLLNNTSQNAVENFINNIEQIYWFEINEKELFYINSLEPIIIKNSINNNYCSMFCKLTSGHYLFYSNLPSNVFPYTVVISSNYKEVYNNIPLEYSSVYY